MESDKTPSEKMEIKKPKPIKARSKQTKRKYTRPLVGMEDGAIEQNILTDLANMKLVVDGKGVFGCTEDHARVLKSHAIFGLNAVMRAIEKDLIKYVVIVSYRKANEGIEALRNILTMCTTTRRIKVYSAIEEPEMVKNLFGLKCAPGVIGFKKSIKSVKGLKNFFD
ncbi:hypothetical protein EIN_057240 [Entamoeba invadens IP1]|uniref:hypothetical protein n=1 Tax=Entamoeba invadens IP1 TaxID=370355 RepID=UPI0002C3E6E9|nr:hypothetical protein EIN_057240 [Entamoeba invadens IP1]ELP93339.1 hypothetical protein EIN_057240 [Entamoeba invadens IP1]|eukprot:XP_004260110.1 hypothetical protein EIN_057240 [Entamoeba invadens IP1]